VKEGEKDSDVTLQ